MTKKDYFTFSGVFLFFFLLLTPLGLFNTWIPPILNKTFYFITATGKNMEGVNFADVTLIPPIMHKGYYSVTDIDKGDDTGYYAYLRSSFFDGDLDFINELNYMHVGKFNETGYVFNNWQIGQSILFLPFFMAGHVHASILNGMGYPVAVDGYSAPYHLWTAIASQTYVFLGIVVLYRLLRKYYNRGPALLAVLASWLASPLVYYTFIRQRMAHGSEFFLSIIFVAVWLHYRESREIRHHAVLGAVLGFLCMARLVGICFLFLYLVDLLYQEISNQSKPVNFKEILGLLGSFSFSLLLLFLPQFYVWNQIDGSIIDYILSIFKLVQGSTGSSAAPVKIFNKFIIFFFSGNWPLSLSAPAWFLGMIGVLIWPPLFKKEIRYGLTVFFILLVFLILTGGTEGAAYGSRYLTLAAPLFAFGLAAILQKASSRSWLYLPTVAFFIFCILLQYLMVVQYKIIFAYSDPNFTIKSLGAIPALILNHPELLLRSTNFVRLFFLDNPKLWDFRDFLFLIVFPLSQLACIVLVFFSQNWIFAWKDRLKGLDGEKIFLVGAVFSTLVLLILIGELAPSKTEKEISNRNIYSALLKKGKAFISGGRNDEAFKLFAKASRFKPELWMPLYGMGLAYNKKGELQKANESYRRLLRKNPYHDLSNFKLGDNLISLGNFEEAEFFLKTALRQRPTNEKVYNTLGVLFVKQSKIEKAREMFDVAVALRPKFGKAHLNLALLESIADNSHEAIVHLKEAIKLGVKNPAILKLSKMYKLNVGEDGG